MQFPHVQARRHRALGSWWVAEPGEKEVLARPGEKKIVFWDEMDHRPDATPDCEIRLINLKS